MRTKIAKTWGAATLLAGLMTLAGGAQATTLTYNDFSSTAGLQLNASATTATDGSGRKVLRVTDAHPNEAGSVFSTTTVNLSNAASFSTAFTFNINNSGGICDSDGCGADGLVFAVQTTSNTAGGLGIGIGYSGLNHSLGVEFDTWDNGAQDLNDGNAVGIDLNGNVTSAVQQHVPVRMNNGDDWNAWIDYNGATHLLEVRLAEGIGAIRPVAAFLSYTVDLAATLGTTNAYVGFTSGTGSAWGNHDIVSWQFNDNYAPIGTPVPASLALLGIGLLGAAVARRRKAA